MQRIIAILFFVILLQFLPPGLINVQAEENKSVEEYLEERQGQEKIPSQENQTEENELENTVQINNQLSLFDYFKMIFALLFVVALIYGLLRFVNKRTRLFGQARMMENLGGISLGTNRSIQLVKVGERVFVVGVSETIQLLKEIDSKDEIDSLSQMQDNQVTPGENLLNKLWKKKPEKDKDGNQSQFQYILKNQLDTFAEGRKKAYERIAKKEDRE